MPLDVFIPIERYLPIIRRHERWARRNVWWGIANVGLNVFWIMFAYVLYFAWGSWPQVLLACAQVWIMGINLFTLLLSRDTYRHVRAYRQHLEHLVREQAGN